MSERWRRVNAATPCPICGKTDWCAISTDGTKALCHRTQSPHKIGDAGFLHDLDEKQVKKYSALPDPEPVKKRDDLAALAKDYYFRASTVRLGVHAAELGVTAASLMQLRVGWDGWAWTFPMSDADNKIIGIMRRREDGRKLSVKGGTLGLFIPRCLAVKSGSLAVCEGATDTAALLSMGLKNVVGRPNCGSGAKLIEKLLIKHEVEKILLVSDNDDVGVRGAKDLAKEICHGRRVKIVTPPAGIKDARAWLAAGGNRKALSTMAFCSPEFIP